MYSFLLQFTFAEGEELTPTTVTIAKRFCHPGYTFQFLQQITSHPVFQELLAINSFVKLLNVANINVNISQCSVN